MTPIAFIADAMGSGKTTAANHALTVLAPSCKLSMAAPGKAMLENLLAYVGMSQTTIREALYGTGKEQVLRGLDVTPRWLMQTLGTEWGRKAVNPDENFWVNIADRRLDHLISKETGFKAVLIDDIRFPNELEWLRSRGGKVIHIIRPDAKITSQHASEGLLRDAEVDAVIVNSGTITDLFENVELALRRII